MGHTNLAHLLSFQTLTTFQRPSMMNPAPFAPKPTFTSFSNTSPTPILNVHNSKSPNPLPSKYAQPSPSSPSTAQACIDLKSSDADGSIHTEMLPNCASQKPETSLQAKTTVLQARSGNADALRLARQLFDGMPARNPTSWNAMILAYARAGDYEEIMHLFFLMRASGVQLDEFTFPRVVKACVAMGEKCAVWQVHGLIVKTGLSHNCVVGGSLVDGYSRVGLMDDAVMAFEEIGGKNAIAWNAVIYGYVKLLKWEEAWKAFSRMWRSFDFCLDHCTFATVVRVCGALRSLGAGKQVHAKLITYGFHNEIFVGNSLIDMYAKCGDDESCLQVFTLMLEKDQVSWNSMISSQARLGKYENALFLFKCMLELGYRINRFNLGSLLMACAAMIDSKTGREVHGYMVRNLLETDVVLGSALVNMYSKFGHIKEAHQTFNRVEEKSDVSWNALLMGYILKGLAEEAVCHFKQMEMSNAKPDQYTFRSLLTLSADQGNEDQGKEIHAHIIRTIARQHTILETELVHVYAKCGRLDYAQKVFNGMLERNAYSWNSLIAGYEQNGQAENALEVFFQMQLMGLKPDCFSLASALSACASLSIGKEGKQIHGYILRNVFEEDTVLKSMLLDMYSKSGIINYTIKIYDQTSDKDVVLHNIMISAFVSYDLIKDARHLFDQMDERSTVSWNSMLTGYSKCGLSNEMNKLFQRMLEEGSEPDDLTFVTMFDLCATLPALEQGKQLHACMIKKGFTNSSVVLDSALIDMYAKGGDIGNARRTFENMTDRNLLSWNAIIAGYANHGCGSDVLTLFDQMREDGIHPNDVTFLSVLFACSHIGLVKEGLRIFKSMVEEYGIETRVEHYTCIVDLLGRAGHLNDAKEMIEKMPIKPDVSTWGALLGACRVHQNVELGRYAAERLFNIDPKNPGNYVLMSNIYAAAGKWKEANEVREMMKHMGITKEPGISWIEIDNEIQTFYASDRLHSKTAEIYATLKSLLCRMKRMGYVPNTSFVLRNVPDQEDHLLQHSERLAIALGLICLPEKSIIRVFKNLRICGDCHIAIKLISKITNRKIMVRDTKRFHNFENGLCSCKDYW